MLLKWESGHSVNIRVGGKVVGLIKDGKRPNTVEFTRAELKELIAPNNLEQAIRHIEHIITTLAYEKQT